MQKRGCWWRSHAGSSTRYTDRSNDREHQHVGKQTDSRGNKHTADDSDCPSSRDELLRAKVGHTNHSGTTNVDDSAVGKGRPHVGQLPVSFAARDPPSALSTMCAVSRTCTSM